MNKGEYLPVLMDDIEGYEADLTTARYEKAVSEWQSRGLRAQIRAYESEYPRKVVEALREAYRGLEKGKRRLAPF